MRQQASRCGLESYSSPLHQLKPLQQAGGLVGLKRPGRRHAQLRKQDNSKNVTIQCQADVSSEAPCMAQSIGQMILVARAASLSSFEIKKLGNWPGGQISTQGKPRPLPVPSGEHLQAAAVGRAETAGPGRIASSASGAHLRFIAAATWSNPPRRLLQRRYSTVCRRCRQAATRGCRRLRGRRFGAAGCA